MGQRSCLNFSQLIKDKKSNELREAHAGLGKAHLRVEDEKDYRMKDGEQIPDNRGKRVSVGAVGGAGKEGECQGCWRGQGLWGALLSWQFTAEETETSTQRTAFMWLKKKCRPRIFYPLKPIF